MKLAVITGDWPHQISGISDCVRYFAEYCNRETAHEFHVVTSTGLEFHHGLPGLTVHPVVERWDWSCIGRVLAELKKIRPDVVHLQYPCQRYGRHPAVNVLVLFLRMAGYRVVLTVHEYVYNLSWKGRVRVWPSILGANRVMVVDPVYIPAMKRVFFWKKYDVIPVGSNIPPTKLSGAELQQLRNRYLDNPDTLLIGFFGFININKVLLPVLDAMRLYADTGRPVRLLMIGDPGPDQVAISEFDRKARDNGLEPMIIRTGRLSDADVASHLAILDYAILLYSSGLSPRNATFQAALSQGTPAVTRFKPDYQLNHPLAVSLPDGVPEAEGIFKILQEGGRKHLDAGTYFDDGWKLFLKKHLEVYEELTGKKWL